MGEEMKISIILWSLFLCVPVVSNSSLPPYYEQYRARVEAGDGIVLYELYDNQRQIGCQVPFKQNLFVLLRKMIDKDGNPRAMAYLGLALLAQNERASQRDRMEGAQWLRRAAEKQDYKALERLAGFYFTGKHGDLFSKDREKAEKMAIQSMEVRVRLAQNGDLDAMWDLWDLRFDGSPLPANYMTRMSPARPVWLQRAAESRHVKAMLAYGDLLIAEGKRKKDKSIILKGQKLYDEASEMSEDGMYHKALFYFMGPIVGYPKDPAKAWYWIDRWVGYTGCDKIVDFLKGELGAQFVPRAKIRGPRKR
jgi:TPR repeat protein